VYVLTHFYQIFGSSHSGIRKIMLLVEFLFQFINMVFSWFAIGNFFLVSRFSPHHSVGKSLSDALAKYCQWLSSGFILELW
jgi:hypothetical protein